MQRRHFLTCAAGAALGCHPRERKLFQAARPEPGEVAPPANPQTYTGPNVILIRFGGGVRRRETVADRDRTWCPFIRHDLPQRGTIYSNVEIADNPGVVTSHGQGTLYLLTGWYDAYEDVDKEPLGERFEPKIPTIFEYFRRQYRVQDHEAVIINGEDRINEEFYTFSNHHQYGIQYRSTVLSLFRFKSYLVRHQLEHEKLSDREREKAEKRLHEMERKDYRVKDAKVASPMLDKFWREWRAYYGDSGLRNPRGDRVLTALALRALKILQPRLIMINYQDPDYVHWGNPHFYTRAISIIDEGVRDIHSAVQADPFYKDHTVFVVIPDCGRDSNSAMSVPFQHHFGSRSAHEIFAVVADAGNSNFVPHSMKPQDKKLQQISTARTIGQIMNFPTPHAYEEPFFKKG